MGRDGVVATYPLLTTWGVTRWRLPAASTVVYCGLSGILAVLIDETVSASHSVAIHPFFRPRRFAGAVKRAPRAQFFVDQTNRITSARR